MPCGDAGRPAALSGGTQRDLILRNRADRRGGGFAHPARARAEFDAAQHDRQRGAHLRQDRRRGICEMRELC